LWLLVSIGLYRRYPLVDTIWNVAWLLLLIAAAGSSVVNIFRDRGQAAGYVGYRGVPRWVIRLFYGKPD
jgi:hypothetical protein